MAKTRDRRRERQWHVARSPEIMAVYDRAGGLQAHIEAALDLELTPRELDIVACAVDGMTARQTAQLLGVAEPTIYTQAWGLRRKLEAKTLVHAAVIWDRLIRGTSEIIMPKHKVTIEWRDRGRDSTEPANPEYPDGIDLDCSGDATATCLIALPYPPYPPMRCGMLEITCNACGFRAMVTTAGRADDPRSIRIPCKLTAAIPGR